MCLEPSHKNDVVMLWWAMESQDQDSTSLSCTHGRWENELLPLEKDAVSEVALMLSYIPVKPFCRNFQWGNGEMCLYWNKGPEEYFKKSWKEEFNNYKKIETRLCYFAFLWKWKRWGEKNYEEGVREHKGRCEKEGQAVTQAVWSSQKYEF